MDGVLRLFRGADAATTIRRMPASWKDARDGGALEHAQRTSMNHPLPIPVARGSFGRSCLPQ
jgi:hypothetical protein